MTLPSESLAARSPLPSKRSAVTPGDYFELIARQTSVATKNVAANELTWFAIEAAE
jgi:hypothetical protein